MSLDKRPIAGDWMLPALQARSQQKRDLLLTTGLELIETVPYAKLNIADIAATAGCSVGTFYRRFPDKQSFLFTLQDLANREFLGRLQTELPKEASPSETVSRAVSLLVEDRRRRRGLATASLRLAATNGGDWMPFYEAAIGFDRLLQSRVAHHVAGSGSWQKAFEISFATQAMYGILNQTTLIRGGAVLLEDDALIMHLTRMCVCYLGIST
jgi:AcrR family transcriptional regulator